MLKKGEQTGANIDQSLPLDIKGNQRCAYTLATTRLQRHYERENVKKVVEETKD